MIPFLGALALGGVAGFVAFSSAAAAVLLGPALLPVGGLPASLYVLHQALGLTAILADYKGGENP